MQAHSGPHPGAGGPLCISEKDVEGQNSSDVVPDSVSVIPPRGWTVFLLLRLLEARHEILQGSSCHVYSCHRDPLSDCPDRVLGIAHEESWQQTHYHGWTALRDASTHVVWIWITNLDDVGSWNPSIHFKVSI